MSHSFINTLLFETTWGVTEIFWFTFLSSNIINPKENQPLIFIGRTDAEAPIFWPPDVKSQFIEKDPDVGKDWRQEEKGTTEDEMVGWHHWLNGHEFEQTLGDSEGQGNLACCCPWGSQRVWHNRTTDHHQQQLDSASKTLWTWKGYLVLLRARFLWTRSFFVFVFFHLFLFFHL